MTLKIVSSRRPLIIITISNQLSDSLIVTVVRGLKLFFYGDSYMNYRVISVHHTCHLVSFSCKDFFL